MRHGKKSGCQYGFSLVEILVVMAMLGVVTMAIYSLFQTTQRSATTEDNVVELQQNLRVALERLGRDIRMAGFMVKDADPISLANANSLTLRTASETGLIVRAAEDFLSPSNPTTEVAVNVASADMVDFFEAGDIVRVLRPPDHSQPINSTITVADKDRTVPEIRLVGFPTPGITYKSGDVIVRTVAGAHPNTVAYSLNANGELTRTANGGPNEPIASGLTALNFFYLLDDGTRTDAPADLSVIKAVEVRMTGQAFSQNGTKSREIQGVVNIRNR